MIQTSRPPDRKFLLPCTQGGWGSSGACATWPQRASRDGGGDAYLEEPVVVDHPVPQGSGEQRNCVEQHLALPLLLAFNSLVAPLLKGRILGRHAHKAKPHNLYFSEQSG